MKLTKHYWIFALFIVGIIFISGCVQQEISEEVENETREELPAPQEIPIVVPETYRPGFLGEFACRGAYIEIEITELRHNTTLTEDDIRFVLGGEQQNCTAFFSDIGPRHSGKCAFHELDPEEVHHIELFAKEESSYLVSFGCSGAEFSASTPAEAAVIYGLSGFQVWAQERGISLVGITKDANEVYYQGLYSNETVPLDEVPQWWEVKKGLKKIPDSVLGVMNDKTVYLSIKRGRGYAMATDWLEGTTAGFILEQPTTEYQAVHELGHIVESNGVKGDGDKKAHIFPKAETESDRIFKVTEPYNPNLTSPPQGFIDVYSSANAAENFAQHFMSYVLKAEKFREQMKNDSLLKEKYDFFKKWIFEGKEY